MKFAWDRDNGSALYNDENNATGGGVAEPDCSDPKWRWFAIWYDGRGDCGEADTRKVAVSAVEKAIESFRATACPPPPAAS